MGLFVSVAVEKTSFCFDRLFDYKVDEVFAPKIKVGCFVAVPFGDGDDVRQAVVIKIFNESELECAHNFKLIIEVLSNDFLISDELMKVVEFLHETCFCTWFSALKTVLPAGLFFKKQVDWCFEEPMSEVGFNEFEIELIRNLQNLKKILSKNDFNKKILDLVSGKTISGAVASIKEKGFIFKTISFKRRVNFKKLEYVSIADLSFDCFDLTKKQKLLFEFIKEFGPVNAKEACYRCGVSSFVLKKLKSLNLIKFVSHDEVFFISDEKIDYVHRKPISLTHDQEKVVHGLIELLNAKKYNIALLRGVTGSGKTQIFLKLIDFVIENGKQVILLVPEIVLTSQIVRFFKARFGEVVAVLNSGLTLAQQISEYDKIKKGVAKLVIGTRSAVFAPCENLGLIVMDEEGEPTYKNSEMVPRYHARDVAKFRCFKFKTLLLLASATPSIETQYFAKIGRYFEFVLNKRFGKNALPKVFVVDLKAVESSPIEGVSMPLYVELSKNLGKKEQSIVLLNRRGHNSSVVCLSCGHKASCSNCSAVLTYHSVNRSLICHYCGYIRPVMSVCERCSSAKVFYFGQGTQKIEQDFIKNFSDAKILRLDSDSIFGRADLIKKIKNFEQGDYDILIGTQIVAKGLNFFNVTLVGVIAIDNMLYGSDFRSSEQMFSLLTQVVGRSGRGKKEGRAIIQTYNPENSIILKAAKQNYESFYDEEILERKQFLCPPFCDLCVVNFSSFSCEKAGLCARDFILECRKMARSDVPIKVLGIATPFIEKLNKRYRKRVVIKCRNCVDFRNWIKKVALKVFALKNFSGVRVNIDMNGEIL